MNSWWSKSASQSAANTRLIVTISLICFFFDLIIFLFQVVKLICKHRNRLQNSTIDVQVILKFVRSINSALHNAVRGTVERGWWIDDIENNEKLCVSTMLFKIIRMIIEIIRKIWILGAVIPHEGQERCITIILLMTGAPQKDKIMNDPSTHTHGYAYSKNCDHRASHTTKLCTSNGTKRT